MNILVISAHPGTGGHHEVLLKTSLSLLKKNPSVKVTHVNLYKEGFNPVLAPNEHYTAGPKHKYLSPDVARYQTLINEADRLLFIYPVWWSSMPAILKGFFDRVFTSPFAFKYKPLRHSFLGVKALPQAMLTGKKAVVLMTMGGPRLYDYVSFRYVVLVTKFAILKFCGISSKFFVSYSCHKVDKKKVSELKALSQKAVRKLLS